MLYLKLITEPGTGVHGKVHKDTNVTLEFADGKTENSPSPNPDFVGEKRTMSMTLRSNCCIQIREFDSFLIPDLTVQVMNEDSLPKIAKRVDTRTEILKADKTVQLSLLDRNNCMTQ